MQLEGGGGSPCGEENAVCVQRGIPLLQIIRYFQNTSSFRPHFFGLPHPLLLFFFGNAHQQRNGWRCGGGGGVISPQAQKLWGGGRRKPLSSRARPCGFRIRIDLMRIWFRIRIPDPDPGFDDLKLEKIYN